MKRSCLQIAYEKKYGVTNEEHLETLTQTLGYDAAYEIVKNNLDAVWKELMSNTGRTYTPGRGKKAVLRFTPHEYAYQRKFGMMPDIHYDRILEETGDAQKAGYIINKNSYGIWIDDRIKHWIQERDRETAKRNNGFTPADTTPFDSPIIGKMEVTNNENMW